MSEQTYLARFDELNMVKYELLFGGKERAKGTFADVLFEAYMYGFVDTLTLAGVEPIYTKALAAIEKSYEGVSILDRMVEHVEVGNLVEIDNLLESEFHRVYNDGARDAAKASGKTRKTWLTMNDDKVRDTHEYLEGVTVDIDAEFITYDGDSAQYPGDFALAQNNARCRCILRYE